VSGTAYLFTLEAGPELPEPRPGQFVNVAVPADVTLRRPFSVAGVQAPGSFDLLVEVRGKGTRALADMPEGTPVDVLGPLGNELSEPAANEVSFLVAGGIGVAGLRFFAQTLRSADREVHALVGARSADLLLHHTLPQATADGGMTIETATDDGSEGFRGTVTGLLERALDGRETPGRIYCCGPPVMIAATARIADAAGVRCEALLEEMMACGVGACRGCVVATRSGYRSVCADGPVFDTSELLLEELVGA
jgi:dihydroorotate dehydrogenase electron transfer subunit